MNTLVIENSKTGLAVEKGQLWVRSPESTQSVPLKSLDTLILGKEQKLDVRLLQKLVGSGITIVCPDSHTTENSLVISGANSKTVHRRITQYGCVRDPAFTLEETRRVVTLKLEAQLTVLEAWKRSLTSHTRSLHKALQFHQAGLELIRHAHSLNALRGYEGTLQKAWFESYFQLFSDTICRGKRSRQPPEDPVNALLSLGYTLLYKEMVSAIQGACLDPYLGFFHQPVSGRFSLACDLMEPLRVHIDQFVYRLIAEQSLRAHHFGTQNKACLLTKAGKPVFFKAWHVHKAPWVQACQNAARAFAQTVDAFHSQEAA